MTDSDIDCASYGIFDYLIEHQHGHAFEKLRLIVKDFIYENSEEIGLDI